MRHLVYNVIYFVVHINYSLLTMPLYTSVKTTLFCKDTNNPSSPYNRLRLYVGTGLLTYLLT